MTGAAVVEFVFAWPGIGKLAVDSALVRDTPVVVGFAVCAGLIYITVNPCVDLAVNVDVFPKPNGGKGVRDLSWQGGGKVATGMVAAARLGAKCAMLGAVGDDDYGKFVLRDFERHGIDVHGMQVRPGQTTSLSIVLSSDNLLLYSCRWPRKILSASLFGIRSLLTREVWFSLGNEVM